MQNRDTSTKLSAIIVDDERTARDELEELLIDHCPEVRLLAKTTSVAEARLAVLNLQPDLVFLDVKMPGESGFDFIDSLSQQETAVVFVTAYDEYAVRAFKAAALHYLVKPCTPAELKHAIDRARNSKTSNMYVSTRPETSPGSQPQTAGKPEEQTSSIKNSRVVIAHKAGFNVVRTDDLMYLEGSRSYTVFYTANEGSFTASRHIGFFETQLPADRFLRTHRSYMINLDHVKGYKSGSSSYLIMSDGKHLEVSRRKLKDLLSRLTNTN